LLDLEDAVAPFARAGDLGPNEEPLAGTWQVAFLGEIEPRAARPGFGSERVMRVGPRLLDCARFWPAPLLGVGSQNPTNRTSGLR
jgi:hypothetical protein